MVAGVALATGWALAACWDLTPRQLTTVAREAARLEAQRDLALVTAFHVKHPAQLQAELRRRAFPAGAVAAALTPSGEAPARFEDGVAVLLRAFGRPEEADRVERRARAAELLARFSPERFAREGADA